MDLMAILVAGVLDLTISNPTSSYTLKDCGQYEIIPHIHTNRRTD